MFIVAFGVRAVVAIGLHVAGLEIQSDEAAFWGLAQDLREGTTDGWNSYEAFLYRASHTLVLMLAGLQAIPGPSELYARIAMALIGAGSAAVVALLGIHLKNERVGLVAGGLVALWPSQVVYSTVIHRDALVWLGVALLALLLLFAFSWNELRARLAVALGAAGVLYLLFTLRPAIGSLAGVALVIASGLLPRRSLFVGTSLTAVILIPLLLGFGAAGMDVLGSKKFVNPDDLPPVAAPDGDGVGSSPDDRQDDPDFACTRISRPYPPTDPGRIALRTLRGLGPVMFGPLPWRSVCSTFGSIAKIEALLWGFLVLATGIGFVRSRRHIDFPWRKLFYGLVFASGLWVSMAYFERTIGTAFRHRQQLFWVIALTFAIVMAGRMRTGQVSEDQISEHEHEHDSVPGATRQG